VADDILFGEPILLAEIDAKFYGFLVTLLPEKSNDENLRKALKRVG